LKAILIIKKQAGEYRLKVKLGDQYGATINLPIVPVSKNLGVLLTTEEYKGKDQLKLLTADMEATNVLKDNQGKSLLAQLEEILIDQAKSMIGPNDRLANRCLSDLQAAINQAISAAEIEQRFKSLCEEKYAPITEDIYGAFCATNPSIKDNFSKELIWIFIRLAMDTLQSIGISIYNESFDIQCLKKWRIYARPALIESPELQVAAMAHAVCTAAIPCAESKFISTPRLSAFELNPENRNQNLTMHIVAPLHEDLSADHLSRRTLDAKIQPKNVFASYKNLQWQKKPNTEMFNLVYSVNTDTTETNHTLSESIPLRFGSELTILPWVLFKNSPLDIHTNVKITDIARSNQETLNQRRAMEQKQQASSVSHEAFEDMLRKIKSLANSNLTVEQRQALTHCLSDTLQGLELSESKDSKHAPSSSRSSMG
jgi:tRNA(Leu) C34 or U34 (ribose-2'-O)-methylase TrmL